MHICLPRNALDVCVLACKFSYAPCIHARGKSLSRISYSGNRGSWRVHFSMKHDQITMKNKFGGVIMKFIFEIDENYSCKNDIVSKRDQMRPNDKEHWCVDKFWNGEFNNGVYF